jgi:cation diffusion facilitator family transporter
VVNIAAAAAAWVAVRLGAKPADPRHPYGHHKAEYLSAVLEGVLIVVAALLIIGEAYLGFAAPRPLDAPTVGLLVSMLASVVNGSWAALLIRVGRLRHSPALTADGWHLFSDVLSSLAVLAGVALAVLTGWGLLDPALAMLMALVILWTGWRLVRDSVGGLMDEAVEPELFDQIRRTIEETGGGSIEAHDLKTRRAGSASFVDFHLVVPGTMSVTAAHEICDRIERALRAGNPSMSISIHVEPHEKAKGSGVLLS